MKDKLLFGTIGLLVGVVVMQWMMPSGRAELVDPPVGVIVGQEGVWVVTVDGGVWTLNGNPRVWERVDQQQLPIPTAQLRSWTANAFIDSNGDLWEWVVNEWVNRGQPPVGPIATSPATFGKVKAQYKPKGEKP
jgi:hypothetical protein